jgi:hypothetical protein
MASEVYENKPKPLHCQRCHERSRPKSDATELVPLINSPNVQDGIHQNDDGRALSNANCMISSEKRIENLLRDNGEQHPGERALSSSIVKSSQCM